MPWKFDLKSPVSMQIAHRLRLEIVNGTYLPGQTFPTVRSLSYDAAVNPNTVQKALTLLEGEGLLVSRGTVGRFVTEDAELISDLRKKLQTAFLNRVFTEGKDLGITKEILDRYLAEREEVSQL